MLVLPLQQSSFVGQFGTHLCSTKISNDAVRFSLRMRIESQLSRPSYCRAMIIMGFLAFNSIMSLRSDAALDPINHITAPSWGQGATHGRKWSAQIIRNFLKSRGANSILDLNEAQQLVVEAWALIATFYLYQTFPFTVGGVGGWIAAFEAAIRKLDGWTPGVNKVSDAYDVIENYLLSKLGDRYALFLRPHEERETEDIAAGDSVVGLGAVFVLPPASASGLKAQPKVIDVLPGSRAELAGLKYGDRLLTIDGRSIGGREGQDAATLISGAVGTTSHVEMLSKHGKQYEALLERIPMRMDPVKFSWITATGSATRLERPESPDDVGYLRIITFAGPPVAERVRTLLGQLTQAEDGKGRGKGRALVLDLRGNSGGRLSEAQGVTDGLLSWLQLGPPRALVLLVDADTASAAEAVGAALVAARGGETRHAVLVMGGDGSATTFGKGEAQAKFELSDGSALLITVERFLSGSFRGISADVVLPPEESNPEACAAARAAMLLNEAYSMRPTPQRGLLNEAYSSP